MLFSIVTPCFNSEKTIQRTLESVLNQSFQDYEYIVVDGASEDRTLQIIESYREKFQGKLTVVSEPDHGIYAAMNKGIHLAKGKIIGIVNSDDFYEKNCLQAIKETYQEETPYQIIYGMMRIVNQAGEELEISFHHHRNMERNMINHPASFVTGELYRKFGCYDVSYRSAADFDFMLKMSREKEVHFVPCHEVVTNFTRGGMSGTYVGIQESNDVRYRNGLIGKKNYLLTKTKNAMKYFLGV
jgi:glycosyltransferase involved in cell wall biosynthesis